MCNIAEVLTTFSWNFVDVAATSDNFVNCCKYSPDVSICSAYLWHFKKLKA